MSDETLLKETLALMASSTSREGVQAIRLASRNKTVDITTHKDNTTGQEVVLWSDIVMVFRDALYLQYGTKAIPFLKGPDFKVLDPLRIATVPGATLEVVIDDDNDDEPSYAISKGINVSQATVQKSKSKSKSARPSAQKSGGPTPSVVFKTPTSQPPSIRMARGAALQAPSLEGAPLTTSFEPTSTTATTTSPQGSFFTSLFFKATPEAPTVRHKQTPRGTSTTAQESSTIESLAVTTNSQETPNDNNDQNSTAPRNPQYGLVEEALENYNHIDVPPELLRVLQPDNHKNDARNPQFESETPINAQLTNRTDQARAPQEYSAVASYKDITQTIMQAKQGDAEAQVALGDMYRDGKGVGGDLNAAHDWFLKAAEQGHAVAQYTLGFMYKHQEVDCLNNAMVEVYFHKAANQGVVEAQYEMGRLYQIGFDRVEQDPEKAMTWYLKAAEQDYAPAMVAIGSLHESGQCGRIMFEKDRNYLGAMEWYLKAATQGDAQAHYAIGRMFDEGVGVVQDDLKARQWYAQAAGRGHADAKKRLLTLGSESRPQVEPASGALRGLIGKFSEAFF